jgi:hypothetical protein
MGITDNHIPGRSRRRLRLAAVAVLSICVAGSFAAGDAAAKKKKKPKATVFAASVAPNLAIPDRPVPATEREVPAVSTITVGKKFKGKTVGDVNVTGIQTTGSAANAVPDLSFSLSSPDGQFVLLEATQLTGQNIGPLTLDDDTPTSICPSPTPTCSDPDSTLTEPFAGTANLFGLRQGDLAPLSNFNGAYMKGTWTFRIWDNSNTRTSILNSWGLKITPEKPVT